jgi:hypothetical protein
MAWLIDVGVLLGYDAVGMGSSRTFSALHPRKSFYLLVLYGTISDTDTRSAPSNSTPGTSCTTREKLFFGIFY